MASGAHCSLQHRLESAPSGKLLLPRTHCTALLAQGGSLSLLHWPWKPPAVWGAWGSPPLAPGRSGILQRARQYQAQALAPPGSSRGTQLGFPLAGDGCWGAAFQHVS